MPAIVELIIDGNACKGCGVCVRLCPKKALVIGGNYKVTPLFVEHCTFCKVCEMRCPESAIEIVEAVKVKSISHKLLYLGYVCIIVSGISAAMSVPFSIWVLIKSVSGLGLVALAEIITRGKGNALVWGLLLGIATVGLTIAYFLI